MTNILHFPYIYKNSISLEELIYSTDRQSTLGNSFWYDIKLEYDLKRFRIETKQNVQIGRGHGSGTRVIGSRYSILPVNNNNNSIKSINEINGINGINGINSINSINSINRINGINRIKSIKNIKSINSKNSINGIKSINSKKTITTKINGTILLMYQKNYQEYEIIYKDNDKIFIFQIKSNLGDRKIYNKIKEQIAQNQNILENIYKCKNEIYQNINYEGNLFKIIEHKEINKHILDEILKNNPIIIRSITHPTQELMIDLNEIFKTDLINFKFTNIKLRNLDKIKPIFYINLIFNKIYLEALLKYKNGERNFKSIEVKNTETQGTKEYGVYDNINCIINPNNCGYNFIESYEEKKLVIWLLPFISETTDNKINKYISNFTYFIQDENNDHIKLLETLRDMYLNKDYVLFLHINNSYIFGIQHFHRVLKDNYKKIYPTEEKGIAIIKEININELINKLKIDHKYYNEINTPILNVSIQ